MKWTESPIIKLYEALGAIADGRIEVIGDTARVYSSSRGKYYEVKYDSVQNAITANDNGSFYVGYLGYPSIAFLLVRGIVSYDPKLPELLKGFHWKDINQKFKNDFAKTEAFIRDEMVKRSGVDLAWFDRCLQETQAAIVGLKLNKLPSTTKPPTAY